MLRTEAFYTIAPYSKCKTPADLFKFPWEEKPKQVSKISHKRALKIAENLAKKL